VTKQIRRLTVRTVQLVRQRLGVKLAAQPHEERSPKWSRELVSKSSMPALSELALRYGAGIETETSVPREAYARVPEVAAGAAGELGRPALGRVRKRGQGVGPDGSDPLP
jgi:hypothetical protein